MNLKTISLIGSISSCLLMVSTPISFEYRYEIISNSFHPFDQTMIYGYKEQLIDTYESLCFDYLERDYQDIIINNIDLFRFDEYCVAEYINGAIVIVIGNGNGPSYKGDLRKNSCDGSVVREKFYIYELFN